MNFNRMTIIEGQVYKVKRVQIGGYATDMAAKKFEWVISGAAKPLFTGSQDECLAYIAAQGAEYQSIHRPAAAEAKAQEASERMDLKLTTSRERW